MDTTRLQLVIKNHFRIVRGFLVHNLHQKLNSYNYIVYKVSL